MRAKPRLTITLDKDLLQQIDNLIDGLTIRNRSHAIETLVRQSLGPQVTNAVILAGKRYAAGKIPPLSVFGERPLLVLIIRHLITHGLRTIYILAGENEKALRAVVAEGPFMGAEIVYVPEAQPMGTAGAIKQIEEHLLGSSFLVVHGDVLTNIDLTAFIEFHRHEDTLATIATKPRDAEKKYGKVMLQGNKITAFSQADESEGLGLVNTGVYILQPEVLGFIEAGQVAQFERDIFPRLAVSNELSAYLFQGVWFDISTPESYQLAQERWTTIY